MTRLQWNTFGRLRWRVRPFLCRVGACLALMGYVAAVIGFPVPRTSPKDHRQPFPCQDHPCGCQSAEQCWQDCCCFSREEHWAWAKAHHVEPPSYAVRPAAPGWKTVRLGDHTAAGERSSVSRCASQDTCQHCSSTARKSCCSSRPEKSSPPQRPVRIAWMLGVTGLKCQGASTLWLSVGAALPPPTPLEWRDALLPVGWLRNRDGSALPLPLNPPDPPPRPFCV
jgi:hypothetical protein